MLEKIRNKKSPILMIITLMILVVASTTFAWLTWSSYNNTELTMAIGNIAEVTFKEGRDINMTNIGPILDYTQLTTENDEVTNFLIKKRVSTKMGTTISLNISRIDSSLIDKSFKYVIEASSDDINFSKIKEGDFSTASVGNYTLLSNSVITSTYTYYKLYIFIDGYTASPHNLMNSNFASTIVVDVEEIIDFQVSSITVNGSSSNNIPQTGLYTLSNYNCTNGTTLTWEPYSKTLETSNTRNDTCSLAYTTMTPNKYLYQANQGDYVAYVGVGGTVGSTLVECQNDGDAVTGTGDAESSNSCLGNNANDTLDTNPNTYGYCSSSSYKYYVKGWRIAYIDTINNKAVIVSAGSPECNIRPYASSEVLSASNTIIDMGNSTIAYATNYIYNSTTGKFSLDQTSTITSGVYSSIYASVNGYYTCRSSSQTGTCSAIYYINSYSNTSYAYADEYTNMSLANTDYIELANTKALKYCNTSYVDGNCTCLDTDSDGDCDTPSTDAWAINDDTFYNITTSIMGGSNGRHLNNSYGTSNCTSEYSAKACGYNNDLIDNGGYYWFASYYSTSSIYSLFWNATYRNPSSSSVVGGAYGTRPVISLSSSVIITGGSGTMEDPYTISNES